MPWLLRHVSDHNSNAGASKIDARIESRKQRLRHMESLCQLVPRAWVVKSRQLSHGFEVCWYFRGERPLDIRFRNLVIADHRVFRGRGKCVERVGIEHAG